MPSSSARTSCNLGVTCAQQSNASTYLMKRACYMLSRPTFFFAARAGSGPVVQCATHPASVFGDTAHRQGTLITQTVSSTLWPLPQLIQRRRKSSSLRSPSLAAAFAFTNATGPGVATKRNQAPAAFLHTGGAHRSPGGDARPAACSCRPAQKWRQRLNPSPSLAASAAPTPTASLEAPPNPTSPRQCQHPHHHHHPQPSPSGTIRPALCSSAAAAAAAQAEGPEANAVSASSCSAAAVSGHAALRIGARGDGADGNGFRPSGGVAGSSGSCTSGAGAGGHYGGASGGASTGSVPPAAAAAGVAAACSSSSGGSGGGGGGASLPGAQPAVLQRERGGGVSVGEVGGSWRPTRAVDPGRLQVWWTPLDQASTCDPGRVERYRGCLSPAEAEEVARSKTVEVAAKRTAARALARCVLARAVSSVGADKGSSGDGSGSSGDGNGNGNGSGSGSGSDNGDGSASSSYLDGADGVIEGSAAAFAAAAAGGGGAGTRRRLVQPQELEFERNSYGKPHLVHRPGWPTLRHNLTHTGDLAGVAVYHQPASPASAADGGGGDDGAVRLLSYSVGLDVERLDRSPRDPLALARRQLAAAEVRDLEVLTGEARARHFMWLWTLKEAYVKARGTGINAPPGLKGFAIGFEDICSGQTRDLAAASRGRYQLAPAVKTITLRHTTTHPHTATPSGTRPPAASSSSAPAAATATAIATSATTPGAAPSQQVTTTATGSPQRPPPDSSPAGLVYDSSGTCSGTQYSFLLFQPTPLHVGALCLAVSWTSTWAGPLRSHAGACPGSHHLVVAAAPGGGTTARGGALGAGAVEAAQLLSYDLGCGLDLGRGALGQGAGAVLAALVDHWWCVPLEREMRLDRGGMVLLGASP